MAVFTPLCGPIIVYCVYNGVKEPKVVYFDGSYYQDKVNFSGKENGQGCICYACSDFLKGRSWTETAPIRQCRIKMGGL